MSPSYLPPIVAQDIEYSWEVSYPAQTHSSSASAHVGSGYQYPPNSENPTWDGRKSLKDAMDMLARPSGSANPSDERPIATANVGARHAASSEQTVVAAPFAPGGGVSPSALRDASAVAAPFERTATTPPSASPARPSESSEASLGAKPFVWIVATQPPPIPQTPPAQRKHRELPKLSPEAQKEKNRPFTPAQRDILCQEFAANQEPGPLDLARIAGELGVELSKVKKWFARQRVQHRALTNVSRMDPDLDMLVVRASQCRGV